MATDEVEEIIHTIGSHLKFEDIISREIKPQEALAMPRDENLKHIKKNCGVYYPEFTDQVVDLVKYGRREKKIARCKGAGHSINISIYQPKGVDMVLSGDLRAVSLVEELPEGKALFKVGGGCYIGVHPMDPNSTRENSLSYQISQLGYAISIVGGISHQSIAGFMLTGSSGGSVKFGFPETIREIQFVNGKGEIKTVSPTVDSHLFYAVGVSMGLFGIVISVTIEVDPYYNVEGKESNVMEEDSSISPDRFLTCLKEVEYYHVQWLPQKGVNRVDEFIAQKTQSQDIKPYHHEIGNTVTAIEGAVALKIIDEILKRSATIHCWEEKLIAFLLKKFLPIPFTEIFCDYWYIALPNDDLAPVDSLMKVNFMEMWFPIDYANDMIRTLKEKVYTDPKKSGSIATELYASRESPFWLSMAYGRDVVRLDKLRYSYDIGSPSDYYKYFWEAFMSVKGMRFHWGKWMPENGQTFDNVTFNLAFLKNAYPNLGEWLLLREEMDPDQIFVSDHWRSIFEIPRK